MCDTAVYHRRVFLQDLVEFRQFHPDHVLWNLEAFQGILNHPAYPGFRQTVRDSVTAAGENLSAPLNIVVLQNHVATMFTEVISLKRAQATYKEQIAVDHARLSSDQELGAAGLL